MTELPIGAHTRVILDPVRIRELTTGRGGPVVRELIRRTDLFLEAARRQIRIGHVAAGTGSRGINLRDTGYKRIIQRANGEVAIEAGFNHPIALIHHEGTKPHLILPRYKSVLVFPTVRGVVFAKRVHHPGTHPNRYLTDNLRIITR